MMASSSRELSQESISSTQKIDMGLVNGEASGTSTPHPQGLQEAVRSDRSIGTANRPPSHSLMGTATSNASSSRKSRFADVGTVGGSVERASLSMPPPATKPSSIYRPAASRQPNSLTSVSNPGSGVSGMDNARESATSSGLYTPEDSQNTGDLQSRVDATSEPLTPSRSAESNLKPPYPGNGKTSDRRSFSSLYSAGSGIFDKPSIPSAPQSAASSSAGSIKGSSIDQPISSSLSPPQVPVKGEITSNATTATDPISVTANSKPLHQVSANVSKDGAATVQNTSGKSLDSWNTAPVSRPSAPRRTRSKTKVIGQPGGSTAGSSAGSPSNSDRIKPFCYGKVGVCALDIKARSKASRNILTRLSGGGEFEVIIFGDKVILDEEVENWPVCDFLISFFSDGFPLDKAIEYYNLRKPFCVNDLPMQKILWDRRICLRVLDIMGVPTPKRIEVNRDGGPRLESKRLADHVRSFSGVKLEGPSDGTGGGISPPKNISLVDDGDTLLVDGMTLQKPFVEKPVSGEDHNIYIYFPKSHDGGGGRRLFRKVGNKSSEWDKDLVVPRSLTENDASYLYEKFLRVDNSEDIKAYTVGPEYCHAETRTSPVVDGVVRRNTHGKEIRYICNLSPEEKIIASKVANGFGQRVCGFDMLRVGDRSFVIDVNGWSFVKDNNAYYDQGTSILRQTFITEKQRQEGNELPLELPRENSLKERVAEDNSKVELGTTQRRNTHRSALKDLMKSPSMSKLRGRGHQSQTTTSGGDFPSPLPALSSPPTLETDSRSCMPSSTVSRIDQLPPPAVPSDGLLSSSKASLKDQAVPMGAPQPASKHSWKLKGMVSVIRHADRTPKQKFKFTFHTQPFINLLRGHQEEVLLKGEVALNSVMDAVRMAIIEGVEDRDKLQLLKTSLARKGAWTGTKVQIKPMFRKRKPEELAKLAKTISISVVPEDSITGQEVTQEPEEDQRALSRPPTRSDSLSGNTLSRYSAAENDLVLDKLQLIVKWGGEPTHSARYQSQDLGENMREDMLLLNKGALDDVHVFTSSERRVSTSGKHPILE